jgi:hypothetical protein
MSSKKSAGKAARYEANQLRLKGGGKKSGTNEMKKISGVENTGMEIEENPTLVNPIIPEPATLESLLIKNEREKLLIILKKKNG